MFTKNRKKLIKSLHQKKYRDLHGLFLVEGEKMVRELQNEANSPSTFDIEAVYTTKSSSPNFPLSEEISDEDMQSISTFKNASGVLALVKQPSLDIDFKSKTSTLILDNLKDPGNLGTIIRSAEWFGIDMVILSNETVELYNPKTVQATMGSIFRIPIWRSDLSTSIERLKAEGFTLYAADMNGQDIKNEPWATKKGLIVGSEAHGLSEVSRTQTDKVVSIKGSGKAESLNAGVAASIIISHW